MEGTGIVVAVDGSDTAQEALRWAVALAEALGAEVVAVHAVGLLEALHDPGMPEHAWRAGLRDVVETTWCAPLAKARCPHRVELRDGHPVDVVLGAVDDEHAVLLVVGSRGVGTNPAMALGSTSLRVLQAARVPVLVVPDARDGAPLGGSVALRRILVGLDRSEPSFAALELASDVADLLGGSLSVLEVIDYVPPFPLGTSTAVTGKGEEQALERAIGLLESEVRDIRTRGVSAQVIVRSGDPAPTLLAIADDVDADLVVVGTRGRGGPADLLLGSVARTVADRARRPTLVVPATARPIRLRRSDDRSEPRQSRTSP
jgi:nucleotide-binding universal stress UspA family protein